MKSASSRQLVPSAVHEMLRSTVLEPMPMSTTLDVGQFARQRFQFGEDLLQLLSGER